MTLHTFKGINTNNAYHVNFYFFFSVIKLQGINTDVRYKKNFVNMYDMHSNFKRYG